MSESFTESVVETPPWLSSKAWAGRSNTALRLDRGSHLSRDQFREYDCAHPERVFSGVVRRSLRVAEG